MAGLSLHTSVCPCLSDGSRCECKAIVFAANSPEWRIYGEWAYECNSPPIRNDRKVIARHSYVFVSIRGRSCGLANIMQLSHCGEYSSECKTLMFAANSPEIKRLPRRITEKVRSFKWLRLLANFLRNLRLLNKQFAEFIVNPLRMLRILTNALRSQQMPCHQLYYLAMLTKMLRKQ